MTEPIVNPFADCRTADDVRAALGAAGIERVQIGIFDIDAILRWKRVATAKFLKLIEGGGYRFCDVLYKWDVAEEPYGSEAYGDAPVDIDLTSGRLSPESPREALFIADFAPPFGDRSPRRLLQAQLAKAADRGLSVTAAFEYETNFFEETPHTVREKGWRDFRSFQPNNRTYSAVTPHTNDQLFDAIEAACHRGGITLDSMHTELGPGCFEFPLAPEQGVRAADHAALFRLFCRITLAHRGLMPVFMAKWSNDWPGQSGHLHISLQDADAKPVFHDPADPQGLSQACRHFIGGLCQLMPEMLSLCSHTVNAFRRLVPGAWAPIASTWGVDNRTTAIRALPGSPASTRIEFRVPAADANPHLALAMALAGGLWGMDHQVEPPAESVGEAYTQEVPAERRFPRTLLEAAERLQTSAQARALLGDTFVDYYAHSRIIEDERVRAQVTELDRKRYFETF